MFTQQNKENQGFTTWNQVEGKIVVECLGFYLDG
jgi:hypothetical protein